MWALGVTGILLGVAILAVFRLTSDQKALEAARRKRQAHFYELRLFPDEPALIWRAQKGLLAANARYLRTVLLPALAAGLPCLLLYPYLEAFFAYAPLSPGQAAVLTVQASAPVDEARLEAPAGIRVETPAVRVPGERQVSWRFRPLRPVTAKVRVLIGGEAVEKAVVAGNGLGYLATRRVRSLADAVWHRGEARLPAGPIEWIEIRYPPSALAMGLPWTVWLLLFSALGAAAVSPLLKRMQRFT
ncbi:MAG TPA: hypothetical protein VG672_07970 [Bryobacteraceae bacterium]|jgi:hypothetical protein|nr:hypothetical protein [Bryobacteraceae bacterium]